MSADDFLDQLARRWVREAIDDLEKSAATVRQEVAESLRAIDKELGSLGGADVLRWCRRAALGQEVGKSVVLCDGMKQLLMAFAVLASEAENDGLKVRSQGALEIGGHRIEAVVACEPTPAHTVRQRARRRAEELANQGAIGQKAAFLVSGVIWGLLDDDPDIELDMTTGSTDPEDLVVGSDAVRLSFHMASDVVKAA